jgi:hypothetical protein
VVANERRRHGVVGDCYTWYTSIFVTGYVGAGNPMNHRVCVEFSIVRVAATDEMLDTH